MESLIIRVYAVVLRSWRNAKMPKWGYSITAEELDPEKTVKASGREVRVSPKHAREICRTVKGMKLAGAKEFLLDVMEKKKAVPFRRYQKKAGHRRGLEKAFAGRYPIKAAERVLKILQGAQANAENKGLDVDKLQIIHAAAYPGMKIKRFTPRAHGRASPKFEILSHIEIVLGEKPGQGEEA
jgi:large subunit ribosomal protein L22